MKILAFMLAMFFLSTGTIDVRAQASAYVIDVEKLRNVITKAVQRSGKQLDMLIDPSISEQIFANAILFAANFCDDPQEDCTNRLGDTPALQKIVDSYLKDVSALPTETIESFASRLSGSYGRLAGAGWSSDTAVNAGIVELPEDFRQARLALRYATGTVPLGSNASAILMAPGSVEIDAETLGLSQRYQIVVERLKRTKLSSLELVESGSVGGRLSPSSYCQNVQPPPYIGPFALFNTGRSTISESDTLRRANEAPFIRQTSLNISVEYDPSITCDISCKAALASLLADSIATWRNGCEKCDANAMALITSMGTTWLDWRVVHRLTQMAENSSVKLNLNEAGSDEQENTAPLPLGSLGPIGRGIHYYVDVTANKTIIARVCQLDNSAAPWVRGAKNYLCSAATPNPTERLRPSIVLKDGETACRKKAVACALPSERVEVNLGQYRYSIPTSLGRSEIIIGPNDSADVLDMRRILLHEIGHWFGVPHSEEGGGNKYLDVMAEDYDDINPCVSAHSLRMMSNAADLRWSYRIKEGGGALKGPRGSSSVR